MVLLRRPWHLVSILLLIASVACAVSAQSARPREPEQGDPTATRQGETDIQLQAIAAELRAIREQQARIEKNRATKEAAQRDQVYWPPVWSNWAVVVIGVGAAIIALQTLGALRDQVTANIIAANAANSSAKTAENSVTTAKAMSQLDQRAWVGIVEFIASEHEPIPRATAIVLRNTGKTPAINMRVLDPISIAQRQDVEIGDYDQLIAESKRQIPESARAYLPAQTEQFLSAGHVIAPGAAFVQNIGSMLGSSVLGNTMASYIVGKITYNDVFPNSPLHTTKFCLRRLGSALSPHRTGNSMD